MLKKRIEDAHNYEIQILKAAMETIEEKRMYERYQAVLLHLRGVSYKEITDIVNRSIHTIGNYVRAYKVNGLKGLERRQSLRRNTKLTEEQEQLLSRVILVKTPEDVGFPAVKYWNSLIIQNWIERNFNITYSDRGVRQLICRLGFIYTKPIYTFIKKDSKN